MVRVFLIHSDADATAALLLRSEFEFKGHDVTSSCTSHSKDATETFEDRLSSARLAVCLCSSAWLACRRCQNEFAAVRARGLATFAVPLDDFKDENGVLDGVRTLDPNGEDIAQLTAALPACLPPHASDAAWTAGRIPYPGFSSYTEDWAPVFFGRDREIQRIAGRIKMLWRVRGSSLVALIGPAGSGLSSLMRAGVLPHMHDDAIVVPVLRPGAAPLRSLACALSAALGREADSEAFLSALGETSQESLKLFLEQFAQELAKRHSRANARIVVAIDQIGDILYSAEQAQAQAFERVICAAGNSMAPITFLLPMSVSELELLQRRQLAQSGIEAIPVCPMDETGLEDIIRKPLQAAKYEIEDSLVAALLYDAGTLDRTEAPARLSFALRKLCEACGDDKLLRLSDYASWTQTAERGNPLDVLIARFADAAFDRALPSAQESAAWRTALGDALVVLDQHKRPVRRLIRLYTLLAGAEAITIELLSEGLLSRHASPDGAYVEIASHVLFSSWPRLRSSVETLVDEPLLIVSHREIASEPDCSLRPDARRSPGTHFSSKRYSLPWAAQQAAAAIVVFVTGMGIGKSLLSNLEPASFSVRVVSAMPDKDHIRSLSMLPGGVERRERPAPAARVAETSSLPKSRLALQVAGRHKLSRERRDRALAETRAAEARGELEQTRASLFAALTDFEALQGKVASLEERLTAEHAGAESNAAKIAELTAQRATETREPTAALLASDTGPSPPADEQRTWNWAQSAAADTSTRTMRDLEARLNAAESSKAEFDLALAEMRAAHDAGATAVQDLDRRLRETQAAATSDTERLKQDLARERDLREQAESAVAELQAVERTAKSAASEAEDLRLDLSRDGSLRNEADKELSGLERRAAKQAAVSSGPNKARNDATGKRWRQPQRAARAAQAVAVPDRAQTSGWKAISPPVSTARHQTRAPTRLSVYARSLRD